MHRSLVIITFVWLFIPNKNEPVNQKKLIKTQSPGYFCQSFAPELVYGHNPFIMLI